MKSPGNRIVVPELIEVLEALRASLVDRSAWARLRKFKDTDSARITRLSVEEAQRLTNAAAADFRQLLELALLTGARYRELTAFRVRDFDQRSGTLLVAESPFHSTSPFATAAG